MKMMIVIIALLLLFQSNCKLYQVLSIFRHGARYHLNSIYDGNSTLNMWGQLTAVGMKQQQNLGKMLRKQYINKLAFLNDKYNASQIEIYSTKYNRTIQSVLSQLYGLYPLGNGPNLNYVNRSYHLPPYSNKTDIDEQNFALPNGHQPIEVQFNDKILIRDCPYFDREVQKNINARMVEYQQMNLTYTSFLTKMANLFNISRTSMNFSLVAQIYDTLEVDSHLGRPWPKDFLETDFENLRHLNNWFNNIKFTDNLAKMVNTYTLKTILNNFDERIINPKGYGLKWTFLSAHDTSLVPLGVDLNISSSRCIEDQYRKGSTTALNCESNVDFASSIIFELHSDNQHDYYVMMRYNGKYINLCNQNNTQCNYEEWKLNVKSMMLSSSQVQNLCGPVEEIFQQVKNYYLNNLKMLTNFSNDNNKKVTMGILRLRKDLQQYNKQKINFISLQFPEEHNIQLIIVNVRVPKQSPYSGCVIRFQLQFSDQYPLDAPKLRCLQKIYHPNINYSGCVCLPLLRQQYSPTVNLMNIICCLIHIMTVVIGEDALNPQIGELIENDKPMFQKIVKHTTLGYAINNKHYDKIRTTQ